MASPNTQLQAAIQQFANQPDITPDQVAQLRSAIGQHSDLLAKLNQDATAGQLTGFALSATGSGDRIGTYDKASGVVSLPAASFEPQGTTPAADLLAVLRVQDMSVRFAHTQYTDAQGQQQNVSQDMVTNLQATLNQSPVLAEEIKRAAITVDPTDSKGRHHLEQFAPLTQRGAGGTYNGNDKTMSLPLSALGQPPAHFQAPHGDIGDMTFVIGHEIQHGFNHPGKVAALKEFDKDVIRIAKDKDPINDYTIPLENYLQASREDEARAQLAGWNAIQSRAQQTTSSPTLFAMTEQSTRAWDFVQSPTNAPPGPQNVTARPGLTFNPDLSIEMTPANVAQMGQNYFDKPAASSRLGYQGDSDYTNYYGASMVSRAIHLDRHYVPSSQASQMHLDMNRLGLQEYLMERNGIDLGQNTTPVPYYDTSQSPPALHHFHHTNTPTGHQHIPVLPLPPEQAPSQPAPGLQLPVSLKDPAHPGNETYRLASDAVYRMEFANKIPSGPHSEQLTAALAVKAEQEGIRLGNIQLRQGANGQLDIIERGAYDAPEKHYTLDTAHALGRSVEEHSRDWSEARSPHYVSQAPAAERTAEHAQALQQLSVNDRALFDRIRDQVPAHIGDEHVLQAMVQGRELARINRPERLGAVEIHGEQLSLTDSSAARFRATVDLSEQAPSMHESLERNNSLDQQQAQQQARETQQREQQAQQGPAMQMG